MTQPTKMRLGDRVADVHPDEVENFKAAGFVVAVDLDDAETVTGDGTGEALPEIVPGQESTEMVDGEESNLNSDVDLPPAGDEPAEHAEQTEQKTDDELVELLVKYFRDTELESKPGVGDTEAATGLDVNGKLITRAWKMYTAEAAE